MNQLKRGFTLLELLLVLSIIGIAAALVIPRMSSGDNARTQAQVRELVAELNYARRMALIQGQETRVTLHPPSPDANQSAAQSPKQSGHWYSRGVTIRPKDAKPSKTDDHFSEIFDVYFYPGGGSSGGDFIVQGGKLTARIQINALTGKLKAEFEGDE